MQLEAIYKRFLANPKVCTDTRKDLQNSLFFCLSGENFNGNQFAQKALDNGAAYVVVDDTNYAIDNDRCILVKNSLETLQQLAAYHRKQFRIPVIGITGTNGKTTTKELVTATLNTKYRTIATLGNLNNHIGVPLTLLRITEETEIAVVEMGANHPDEIDFLCQLAQPNFGIITNIGKAHLEGFGSLETIQRTKLALYKNVQKNKGQLFVNFDDPFLKEAAANISHHSYGTKAKYDIYGQISQEFPFLSFNWATKKNTIQNKVETNLFGKYNLPNLLAAVSVAQYFNISNQLINTSLSGYTPQNNRSQFVRGNRNQLILDAYNANPDSLKLALANFNEDTYPNKMVVLGDMLELGRFAHEEHLNILHQVKSMTLDQVVLIGPIFKQFEKKFPSFLFFEDTTEAIENKHKFQEKGKRILIKGSRGIKLESLSPYLL